MSRTTPVVIVGGGVTGLALGAASGAPVLEQSDGPGGICRSYYLRPDGDALDHAPSDGRAYRFEIGGGHWIFGGDPATLARLEELAELRVYERDAVVRLGDLGVTVPYPLQAHVDQLGNAAAPSVARDRTDNDGRRDDSLSLHDWLEIAFGRTLCDLFFVPFHDRYTAGLTATIAPQDPYKSPTAEKSGYNATFRYPVGGLDVVARGLAAECDIEYRSRVVGIDARRRTLTLADGAERGYEQLLSTLPLDRAAALAGIETSDGPEPHTSVLVVNIGAERRAGCPDCHWQYEADSRSGFHRIGFYSNVDSDFLPADRRDGSHVSLYVERAFRGSQRPDPSQERRYVAATIEELRDRDYIGATDVVHASWVDVAYTWRTPGSHWREQAIDTLEAMEIHQVGRYGRWHFQGIADSIAEGLEVGEKLRR